LSSKVKGTQAVIMTIMGIQPRESPGSAEQSNDDIVYELAETILGRLVETINADECLPSLLQVTNLLTRSPHNIKNLVLWDIVPCSLLKSSNTSQEHVTCIFRLE
jgi:hypothetical protein